MFAVFCRCTNSNFKENKCDSLSLDSIKIKKTIFNKNAYSTDSNNNLFLSDDYLKMLLSCKISNFCQDTFYTIVSSKNNYAREIDMVLQIKANELTLLYGGYQEIHDPRVDTFKPGTSKIYCIPYYGFESILDSSILYSRLQFKVTTKDPRRINSDSLTHSLITKEMLSPLIFVLKIDPTNNTAIIVDSTLEDIFHSYIEKGFKKTF
ncbi:MAG: hypothetical protein R3D58_12930 [Saprospiraceae bacterium]